MGQKICKRSENEYDFLWDVHQMVVERAIWELKTYYRFTDICNVAI